VHLTEVIERESRAIQRKGDAEPSLAVDVAEKGQTSSGQEGRREPNGIARQRVRHARPGAGKAPDFVHTQVTRPEQALLYRLSGDYNPLHASPQFAKMGGFDKPILHGLCTYGHAGRALLEHAAGSDPKRVKSMFARFVGVVFPGDTLVTEGWQLDGGKWVLSTKTQDGKQVLSNAVAEIAPA